MRSSINLIDLDKSETEEVLKELVTKQKDSVFRINSDFFEAGVKKFELFIQWVNQASSIEGMASNLTATFHKRSIYLTYSLLLKFDLYMFLLISPSL